MDATQLLLSEVTLDEDGKAPTTFRILAKGENRTRKPGPHGVLVFDEKSAASILAEFADGGVDLPIDIDHAMARPDAPSAEKFSAGWFRPVVKDGDLWADDVVWTTRGRNAVESKEWRYTSLWGLTEVDETKTRARVMRLLNVALVNTPATKGTHPLVMSEETESNDMNAILVALSVSDETEGVKRVRDLDSVFAEASEVCGSKSADAIRGQLRALKLRADKSTELETKLAEVEKKAEHDKRESLIAKLSEAGKLPPALHDWARTLPFPALEAFGDGAPVIAPGDAPGAPQIVPAKVPAVDAFDEALAAKVGLTKEDFAEAKKNGVI